MTDFAFVNNVNTTLAGSVSSGATTMTLSSSANLPTLSPGQTFVLTLNDAATNTIFEVIYVPYGGISGATLSSVLRGQEGTTAQSWNTGDLVFTPVSAGILENFQQTSQPFTGASLAFSNTHADSLDNFSTLSKINSTDFQIPANALTVGAMLRITVGGEYSVTGTPTFAIQTEVGGQALGTYTITAQGSNQAFQSTFTLLCVSTGSSGSLVCIQGLNSARVNSIAQSSGIDGVGPLPSFNTTIANNVNIWASFGAASTSNIVTLFGWSVELIYPGAVVS